MRFCGGCGRPLEGEVGTVAPDDAHDIAQRRHITVMFCDLVDSTSLAGLLDPEDFREVLSDYQHACARAIERFGGYTAQYAGDGVLTYFGYPRAHEDDAQRATHAGLQIVAEVATLNARLRDERGISLQVRIGIHTGVVVAGEMGAGQTRDRHAIVGEIPHVAARLQSIAPPGSVLISEVTRELIADGFETEAVGEKTLKGISRPMGVHLVLRSASSVDRLEIGGARRPTPMVDRREEFALLADGWERAKSSQGAVVHVSGEAGIGKTRLVYALRERLGGQVGAEHLWQCSAHHAGTPLYPVINLLERVLGLEEVQTAEDQLAALRGAARDAGLDPAEAVPLLADLLSVPATNHAGPSLTPRDARAATLSALESLLVANPAHHPLLLVVEDLHWADPTTLELLGRILVSLPGRPVLCVLTFRREFEPPRAPRQPAIEIALGPLRSRDVRALAAAVSGRTVDAATLERVDTVSDGVPLFVEEMLKMLERDRDGDVVAGAASATAVPPTLQGLLTERLDRLPALGEVIDLGAVLGREFQREQLEALVAERGGDLDAALAQLAAEGVLQPVDEAPSRWEFTHGLLQEAAYERLLRRRRQALHGRVAETLVRSFGSTAKREREVIAHHWSCAGEPAKAVPYWHAAGTRAIGRAAFLEAAEHFSRGLEALDAIGPDRGDDLERADFLTHLAASLQAGRGYAADGVDDAYKRARSSSLRTGSQDRLVPVIRGQWMFHLLRAEYGTAMELADEMLALGERGVHSVGLAEGHLYGGLVHMYTGNLDLARTHLQEAYDGWMGPERSDEIYEAQGDTGVGALAYLASVLWNLGHAEESLERSELSLDLAEQVGGPVTRAQAWAMRTVLSMAAEPTELGHWVRKTLTHCVDHNLGYWRAVSSLFSAWLQGRAGELQLGTALFQEALEAYRESGSRLSLPLFHILLADLRLAAGDRHGALDVLRAGEEHIAATGERVTESELLQFKGRVLMSGASPDPHAATAAYGRAMTVAREQNAKLPELRAAVRLTAHQRSLGETCTALERLASLCDWFPPASELPDVVGARALVAAELTAG
jgi:class 3 adenylate cyclase/tetratricopeptide (TPR) repeat protein